MYEALVAQEAKRWSAMDLQPAHKAELVADARRVLAHKAVYQQVEAKLISLGLFVPWWFVGLTHLRESNLNFNCQLAQGDPLGLVSRHVPAGRGPFTGPDAFIRGCLDALIDCAPHSAHWTDWSPGGTAVAFALYNGLGYANKGLPSPYDWSETNQYSRGKYVSDGVFSATAVDVQPGCMGVLKCLMELDPTVQFGRPAATRPQAAQPSQPVRPTAPPLPQVPPATKAPSGLWNALGTALTNALRPRYVAPA